MVSPARLPEERSEAAGRIRDLRMGDLARVVRIDAEHT